MKEMTFDVFANLYGIRDEFEAPLDSYERVQCMVAEKLGRLFSLEIDDDEDCWWLVNGYGSNVARYIITKKPCTDIISIKYD